MRLMNKFWVVLFFVFTSFFLNAQVFTISLVLTPVQKQCFSGTNSVSYVATITPPSGYVYGVDYTFVNTSSPFTLKTSSSATILQTNGLGTVTGNTLTGSFNMSGYASDSYRVIAIIQINNIRDQRSQNVSTTTYFMSGYNVQWGNVEDMILTPSNSSCSRNTTISGATYAKAFSANLIPANNDGWFDFAAQFSSSNSSVFVVIGKSNSSILNPTTQPNYIEFRKTGPTTGSIYVKTNGIFYLLSGVNHLSRITLRRTTGNTLKIYTTGTVNVISGSPTITLTSELNFGVYATALSSGIVNVVSSSSCVFENQFFYLKDEIEETVAYINSGVLKVKFYEDHFDLNNALEYTVKCLNDDAIPATSPITINTSTNWIEIPFGAGGITVVDNNIYLLTVKDSNGKKKYLKFKADI